MEQEIPESVLFSGTMPTVCAYPTQKQIPRKVWEFFGKANIQFYNQKEAPDQRASV